MPAPDYDGVLKDLFQKDHPTIWSRLAGDTPIEEVLSIDFQEVQQRRADLVVRLADNSIFNLEFQSDNDKDMPYRMAMYAVMIGQRYRCPVRQAVLYVGRERMRMEDSLDLGAVRTQYHLVDIREFQANELLRSGRPGDMVLAILASGGPEMLDEIAQCAANLDPVQKNRVLTQISLLCGLRRLSARFKMEIRKMSSLIEDNEIVREWLENAETRGEVKILRTMLESKFGPLSAAVQQLLARASRSDLEQWATRMHKADTIDAVFADQ